MGSAALSMLRFRLLIYYTVTRVQVVLSGFSVRLFCLGINVCMYGCMYSLAALVLVDVICIGHGMNRCSGWWDDCSLNVK